MYWTSHCFQLLRLKSVSEQKIYIDRKTQLVELYKNASGFNLLSCKLADIYK